MSEDRARFKSLALEDCMSAIIDYRGKTPRKTAVGIPLITAKVVKGGRIETPNEFIDPTEYDSWMRRGLPKVGDVLLTTEAPLGEVAQLTEDQIALAQRLILLRGKPELLDNTYLKFLLMSEPLQSELRGRASGTTVVGIKQSELRKVTLPLPSVENQRAIAGVLGALDDKIEQNRRTARALERLARAIFRAWFVDFEPVKAKAAGATTFPSMPQPVFDALPTRFVDSAIGPVPEGWDVGALKDLATLSKTQIKPQENQTGIFDHFSIPAFDAGMRAVVESGSAIKSNKFLVVEGCVLLSKLNPRIPRVWLPPPPRGRQQIASTEFLVFLPRSVFDRYYLYCQFQQVAFRDELAQGASGTSNSHQRVRPNDLLEKVVVVPPTSIRKGFADMAGPIFALAATNHVESATLAAMRDYLLPKLLSGAVRVNEPKRFADEVV
jgi:type I restriction enzyme S subunit